MSSYNKIKGFRLTTGLETDAFSPSVFVEETDFSGSLLVSDFTSGFDSVP